MFWEKWCHKQRDTIHIYPADDLPDDEHLDLNLQDVQTQQCCFMLICQQNKSPFNTTETTLTATVRDQAG